MPNASLLLTFSLLFSTLMVGFLLLLPANNAGNRPMILRWVLGECAFSAQRVLILSAILTLPGIQPVALSPSMYSFMHASLVAGALMLQIAAIQLHTSAQRKTVSWVYILSVAIVCGLFSLYFSAEKSHHTALLSLFTLLNLWQIYAVWPAVLNTHGGKLLLFINVWLVQYSLFLLVSLWLPEATGSFTFSETAAMLNDFFSSLVRTLAFSLMISEKDHLHFYNASTNDMLTGIPNRRGMAVELERAWQRSVEKRCRYVLVMMDIDHFKRVNDVYGHSTGDEVLMALTQRMLTLKREQDLFARWGGEEFILLLKDVATDDAFAIVERMREQISATPLAPNTPTITFSAGITPFPSPDIDSLRALLKVTDDCLYRAKLERNKSVLYRSNSLV